MLERKKWYCNSGQSLIAAFLSVFRLIVADVMPSRQDGRSVRNEHLCSARTSDSSLLVPLAIVRAAKSPMTSRTAIGTAYEALCARFLVRHFASMRIKRCGGANDHGIDLLGSWALPSPRISSPASFLPATPSSEVSAPTGLAYLAGYPIIGQCKYHAKKVSPMTIRELEGCASRYLAQADCERPPSSESASVGSLDSRGGYGPTLSFLFSRMGYSSKAIERATSSSFPLVLITLEMPEDGLSTPLSQAVSAVSGTEEQESFACTGMLVNPAFHRAIGRNLLVDWEIVVKGRGANKEILRRPVIELDAPA